MIRHPPRSSGGRSPDSARLQASKSLLDGASPRPAREGLDCTDDAELWARYVRPRRMPMPDGEARAIRKVTYARRRRYRETRQDAPASPFRDRTGLGPPPPRSRGSAPHARRGLEIEAELARRGGTLGWGRPPPRHRSMPSSVERPRSATSARTSLPRTKNGGAPTRSELAATRHAAHPARGGLRGNRQPRLYQWSSEKRPSLGPLQATR